MRRVAMSVVLSGCVLVAGCSAHKQPGPEDLFNDQAKVAGTLPYPVMDWKAITVSVNRGAGTMATLFGNDAAVAAMRSGEASYPAGAVVALVTWQGREDPHWFGGRIPGVPVMVETVEVGAGGAAKYRRFAGTPLLEQIGVDAARGAAILGMKAAFAP
jgi:Cytochrome P460